MQFTSWNRNLCWRTTCSSPKVLIRQIWVWWRYSAFASPFWISFTSWKDGISCPEGLYGRAEQAEKEAKTGATAGEAERILPWEAGQGWPGQAHGWRSRQSCSWGKVFQTCNKRIEHTQKVQDWPVLLVEGCKEETLNSAIQLLSHGKAETHPMDGWKIVFQNLENASILHV